MARVFVVGMVLAGICATPAFAQLDRCSATEKGSLIVFPKVEVWYDPAYCDNGIIWKDTFVDLTNDYPAGVNVQMYFVNGDYCNWVDVGFYLTANQPIFWSAATGSDLVSPWDILDPGCPPGELDPSLGFYVLRGYIIAWAVDSLGKEIEWNHLKGDALHIDYLNGGAWEYNAFSFAGDGPGTNGGVIGAGDGTLSLDGVEYDKVFEMLLLDFYAFNTSALSSPTQTVTVNTDLTFLPMDIDLRQDGFDGVATKLEFTVWNENESKFTGMTRCIYCWDQELVSNYDAPNHFLLLNIHTDKAKARIEPVASTVCKEPDGVTPSVDSPVLGISAKVLTFAAPASTVGYAGMNIPGMGYDTALIQVDVGGEPPPSAPVVGGAQVGDGLLRR